MKDSAPQINGDGAGIAAEIYDADMTPIDYSTKNNNNDYTSFTYKYSKLPKGTYYVKVPAFYYSQYTKAALHTLKWK